MKTVLMIGAYNFLIPASVNVNLLLQSLAKATLLDHDWSSAGDVYRLSKRERDCPIELKLVADDKVIISEKPPRKAITEKAGPDVHNTFGS